MRQANYKELLAVGEEISGIQEQMDYLQQRMQKQEAWSLPPRAPHRTLKL